MAWNWKKTAGQVLGGAAAAPLGPIGWLAGSQLGGAAGSQGLKGVGRQVSAWGRGLSGDQQSGAPMGASMDRPALASYEGISTLPGGGQLTARQLTGADIQREMEASPWYKMALERQGAEQSRLMDQAARQQAGALAGARTNLAMRGGLRGGAAERLAASGAENLTNLMQQQRQAGAVERGQLGMQGADLSSRLGQFNIGQQASTDVINLQTQLADLANKERRKLYEYGEGMKGFAAGQTAEGIRSGGGGLFANLFGR